MLEQIKKLVRVLKGRDFLYRMTLHVPKKRYGSEYGGWWIAERNLDADAKVLSFGLGEDVSFDTALIEQFGCRVYGFDPTPKSIMHLHSLDLPEQFHLHEVALSDNDGELMFHLPENEAHVSGSLEQIGSSRSVTVECKRLDTIVQELQIERIDILKMDIEGSEYRAIQDIVASSIRPMQILVEYHHFFDTISNDDTKNSISLLREYGYELFSIEGYNYSFIDGHSLR